MEDKKIIKVLIALAEERLTFKQKLILCYLKNNFEKINATKLVSILSRELTCSESTVWNNVNSLRKSKLINCGSLKNKGKPVELTKIGKIIAKNLEVGLCK